MQLKRRDKPDADINVGAFSDIAFLLIIFFILTTTFIKPTGRQLSIPSGSSDPERKEQEQLTVVLTPGEIRYGEQGRLVSLPELRQKLREEKFAKKPEEERIVVLESASNVLYENYFQVVMAITDAGGIIGMIEEGADGEEGAAEGQAAPATPAPAPQPTAP